MKTIVTKDEIANDEIVREEGGGRTKFFSVKTIVTKDEIAKEVG